MSATRTLFVSEGFATLRGALDRPLLDNVRSVFASVVDAKAREWVALGIVDDPFEDDPTVAWERSSCGQVRVGAGSMRSGRPVRDELT